MDGSLVAVDQRLVEVVGDDSGEVFAGEEHGCETDLEVSPDRIGLALIDVGDVRPEVLHVHAEVRRPVHHRQSLDPPETREIGAEGIPGSLGAVFRRPARSQVDVDVLEGHACGEPGHDLGPDRDLRRDLIGREVPESVSTLVGRDALAIAQIDDARPDAAPSGQMHRVPQELVIDVVGQIRHELGVH